MTLDEFLSLFNSLKQIRIIDWAWIPIGHIISETQILVCQGCLILINDSCGIRDYLHVLIKFFHSPVKQADLTLLKFEVSIHIDISVGHIPYLLTSIPVAKHLITSHFENISHLKMVTIFA